MSYEAWGEPDDPPELPQGWWDEDQVIEAKERIADLERQLAAAKAEIEAMRPVVKALLADRCWSYRVQNSVIKYESREKP